MLRCFTSIQNSSWSFRLFYFFSCFFFFFWSDFALESLTQKLSLWSNDFYSTSLWIFLLCVSSWEPELFLGSRNSNTHWHNSELSVAKDNSSVLWCWNSMPAITVILCDHIVSFMNLLSCIRDTFCLIAVHLYTVKFHYF